jgi:hypothetical protein
MEMNEKYQMGDSGSIGPGRQKLPPRSNVQSPTEKTALLTSSFNEKCNNALIHRAPGLSPDPWILILNAQLAILNTVFLSTQNPELSDIGILF